MELPSKDTLFELFRTMLVVRRFEEAARRGYREGRIPGFVHLYIGEEAVATGVCAHLSPEDYITSTHRGHAHALTKGAPPREVMAELWGRATGSVGGRGGSMHLYDPSVGLLGANGIVGVSLVVGPGAAFAARYRNSSQVSVAFFGDGASNTGSFHEGINMASIWNLPVVFVCENNRYATEMPFTKSTAGASIAGRAAAYGIPGVEVDGQDVLAVYAAAEEAIARAREGKGPTILECHTYRYVGHHEGDPGVSYRTREEIDDWKQRDPIQLLENRVLEQGIAQKNELEQIRQEVEDVIDDAVRFAAESPWPAPDEVGKHVFSTSID